MLEAIKQAAISAMEASNPVTVMFGTVTSVDPLEVNVDQRFTLTEDFLVVTERVTRYEVDLSHRHDYTDEVGQATLEKKTSTELTEPLVIRRGLAVGDKVLLLRMQGGQKFVVFDRVVEA